MSNVTISFDVVGSIQQELNILQEDLSPEKLIEKLNTGEYLTTLEVSHPDLNRTKRSIVYSDKREIHIYREPVVLSVGHLKVKQE